MAIPDPSDDALMKAYAAGDAAAFEQLYRRHQAALYRFVRRLLGSALVGADRRGVPGHLAARRPGARSAGSRRARRFAPGCSRSPTIASSTCCAAAAARSRSTRSRATATSRGSPTRAAWQHWPAPAGAAPQGDELAFWRRAGEKLLDCLEQLPLPQRSAFLLHHDDGLTLDEVARALEVGFETAKTRLRYAMSKLRTCMGAYLEPVRGGGLR